MTYRGHVKNGQITLDQAAALPEGAEVTVVVMQPAEEDEKQRPAPGGWRRFAGAINTRDPNSADNERIDADLAKEYGRGLNTRPRFSNS